MYQKQLTYLQMSNEFQVVSAVNFERSDQQPVNGEDKQENTIKPEAPTSSLKELY